MFSRGEENEEDEEDDDDDDDDEEEEYLFLSHHVTLDFKALLFISWKLVIVPIIYLLTRDCFLFFLFLFLNTW